MRDTSTYPAFLDSRKNKALCRDPNPQPVLRIQVLSRVGFGALRCIDLRFYRIWFNFYLIKINLVVWPSFIKNVDCSAIENVS